MSKKIVLLMEAPYSANGGVEVLVRILSQKLTLKNEVHVFSTDSDLGNTKVSNVNHHYVESFTDNIILDFVANEIKSIGPEIIHFHFGGSYVFNSRTYKKSLFYKLKFIKSRIYITNHGVFNFTGYIGEHRSLIIKLIAFPYVWLNRSKVISTIDFEIFVSNSDKLKFKKWYFPFRNKFTRIYHSMLPVESYANNVKKEKIILCVGTVGSRKGQWVLTESFAKIHHMIPDWKLIIIGRFASDDYKRITMRPIIDSNIIDDQFEWIGNASDDVVMSYYKRSAIFVMPSFMEGLGLTLQEAMYYGCSCISTRCGGAEDLVDGTTGILIDKGSVEQMSDAILNLSNNQELRCVYARAAQDFIHNMKMNRHDMCECYEALYAMVK